MLDKNDIEELLLEHTRRLQGLKVEEARKGINTPVETTNEISAIEKKIRDLEAELEALEGIDINETPVPLKNKLPVIAWLTYSMHNGQRMYFPLNEHLVKIGHIKNNDNDIKLDADSISRHHANIIYEDEVFLLENYNKHNATWVGTIRVKKGQPPITLRDGDRFKFGDLILYFYMMHWLEITIKCPQLSQTYSKRTIPIGIGSHEHNEIVLKDRSINPHHATIALNYFEKRFELSPNPDVHYDTISINGVSSRDLKKGPPWPLARNDRLKIGHCLFTIIY